MILIVSFIVLFTLFLFLLTTFSEEKIREGIVIYRQFTNPVHSNVEYSQSVYTSPRDWIF